MGKQSQIKFVPNFIYQGDLFISALCYNVFNGYEQARISRYIIR